MFSWLFGKSYTKSYKEQQKAIEKKLISFDLNIYFIGEDITPLYKNMIDRKKQDCGDIYCYWNYYYHEGNYEEQLEEMYTEFKKRQDDFKDDPKNPFKELIIIKLKKREEDKIKDIFDKFGIDEDVYCPFIIFLLDKESKKGDSLETPLKEEKIENIVPDQEEYNISPLKVFTFFFDRYESESTKKLFKRLWRICSYYNELGEQFIIWPKYDKDPHPYDLIDSDFSTFINIFCLGRTGSGKSTFINKFFNEKRTKQGGTTQSTTSKIVRYGIDGIPIRIYDIPGFEDEKTIDIVNTKLNETANEMNNDKDRVHLILYFMDYKPETTFYKMENKIIETLKKNNNQLRIIFIFTHCDIDPSKAKLPKKTEALIKSKLNKTINSIASLFGENYSIKNNYFQKDQLIQDNLVMCNLMKNYVTNIEEFGFDKIIISIYKTIIDGNSFGILKTIKEKLMDAYIRKIKIDEKLDNEIEKNLSKSYLLSQTTFKIQKERAIKEAEKLYNKMFSIGQTALAISPFLRDIKLGIIKYQKYMFKKNLEKIFGFKIENPSFSDVKKKDYLGINQYYFEQKEKDKNQLENEKKIHEIKKNYHESEVSSTWILANEAIGYISYICLFGGPIGICLGSIGVVGTSIVSYQQFKKDCTEYFEEYKKSFEENKYLSLYSFIASTLMGIQFFENYVRKFQNNEELPEAPKPAEIVETIKGDIKQEISAIKKDYNINDSSNSISDKIPLINDY